MKTGGVCDDGLCLAPVEMNEILPAPEGHKLDIGSIFYYSYEVAGEATQFEKFYGQAFVSQVHYVCKFAFRQLR
jgi:hypothetical protein